MEHIARHEQPHKPPEHLEQLRMRGADLPEGPARLQYEDFLRRVDALLADLGFESIEAFVTGAKETEKNLEALPYLMTLLRKLMEIYETKAEVLDEFEYVVDVSGFDEAHPLLIEGCMVISYRKGDEQGVLFQSGKQVVAGENGKCHFDEEAGQHFFVIEDGLRSCVYLPHGKCIAEDVLECQIEEVAGQILVVGFDKNDIQCAYRSDGTEILKGEWWINAGTSADHLFVWSLEQNRSCILDIAGNPVGEMFDEGELVHAEKEGYLLIKESERNFAQTLVRPDGTRVPIQFSFDEMIVSEGVPVFLQKKSIKKNFTTQSKIHLLTERGEDVLVGKNMVIDRVERQVHFGEKVYFSLGVTQTQQDGSQKRRHIIIDAKGKFVVDPDEMGDGFSTVVHECEQGVFFSYQGKDGNYRVVNGEGKLVLMGEDRHINEIFFVGDLMHVVSLGMNMFGNPVTYVHDKHGNMIIDEQTVDTVCRVRGVETEAGARYLSQVGNEAVFLFDAKKHMGASGNTIEPYCLANEETLFVVHDSGWTGIGSQQERLESMIVDAKGVIVEGTVTTEQIESAFVCGELLLYVTQEKEDDSEKHLRNQFGHVYFFDGELYEAKMVDEGHIAIVLKRDDQFIRKVIDPRQY